MQTARILVVEDEGIIAAHLADRLAKMGHTVVGTVASGEKALVVAADAKPDLVLMDIMLQGDMNGIEAARELAKFSDVPVVYLTSNADAATVEAAVGTAPFGYILKPFNERELSASIQIALYKHRTDAKLHQMERWLAATVSSMGDGVIAADREGRVTLINEVAQRWTGWTAADALGRPVQEVFDVVNGRTGAPMVPLVERMGADGFDIDVDEQVLLRSRSGATMLIDDSVAPIRDASGNTAGVVVVLRDGSTRRQAEDAIQMLTRQVEIQARERSELQESNRALNAFCMSVAHDLRSPLFALNGCSTLMAQRYSELLNEEGREFLNIIQAKSAQMSRLVDDYLRLARLQQASLHYQDVDSNALVQSVLRDLAAEYPAAAMSVVLDPLPRLEADPTLLQQVWFNLLSNALKFTAKTQSPYVHVTGQANNGHVKFEVQDNGAGFDPDKSQRLFTMFQRLHSEADYSGTGIGLAIVAAVVDRHGGTVSAHGALGHGAMFQFTLPRHAGVNPAHH